MMQSNLRGELTSGKIEMKDFDLVDAVARSLHISTPKELSQLGQTLFPAMLNTAVVHGDINKMENLKGYGADLSAVNYDQRTALHLAAAEGNLEVVKFLLLHGAAVHIRDRYDRTPLMEAIINDKHEIIKMLMMCGAHITGSARAVGENVCGAASRGLIKRLDSYRLAGADLTQPDPSGRTALHMACLHGKVDVVRYLQKHNGWTNEKDMLGLTPGDYAERGDHTEIIDLLKAAEQNGASAY
jgi:60kDa lysophospholipase